jgi:hypothetical protein
VTSRPEILYNPIDPNWTSAFAGAAHPTEAIHTGFTAIRHDSQFGSKQHRLRFVRYMSQVFLTRDVQIED